jgi:hypothetical protein
MSILRFKYQFSNSNINFEFKCHFLKFKYTHKSPYNTFRGVTNLVIIMTNETY